MAPEPAPLDETDRALLRLLAEDGRATLQALADKVGLRRASVHERVRKLEARGAIRGYHAALEPEAVGAGLAAFVLLRVERSGDGDDCRTCCEEVAKALRRIPEVLEFHTLASSDDVLLKVRAGGIRELERLVMGEISGVPGVGRVHTLVALATHFERPLQPAPARAPGRERERERAQAPRARRRS